MRVQLNSGMAGVIPAWKIQELLDGDPFVSQREAGEEKLRRMAEEAKETVVLDSASDEPPHNALIDSDEDDEFTKEDFVSALKKASKKLDG